MEALANLTLTCTEGSFGDGSWLQMADSQRLQALQEKTHECKEVCHWGREAHRQRKWTQQSSIPGGRPQAGGRLKRLQALCPI